MPVYSRRARPTLRLLREDLTSGWESPFALRALADGHLTDLHPLPELPHPIITKAAEAFPHGAAQDNFVGSIAGMTRLRLLEIKSGQWRGAVWQDLDTGVHWLIAAGLAKGGHLDRDDLYKVIGRADQTGAVEQWLPTELDERLLKQETAARLILEWELRLQSDFLDALRIIQGGGEAAGKVPHPLPDKPAMADFSLSVVEVREPQYCADELEIALSPRQAYVASNLMWQATIRALITLNPPEQGWDRCRDSFMTIAEPGALANRINELEGLVADRELAQSQPGNLSHYTHRAHLADKTVDGNAVRAMCGAFFVPTQDHASLDVCPQCDQRYTELPR